VIKNKSSKNSKNKEDSKEEQSYGQPGPDMRSILGFLNQNEWISNINIGNIM
jgi:hypothetical protein